MKWTKKDLEKYVQAKEYVDSLLVPLISFQMSHDNDLPKDAYQSEMLSIFMNELEKELTGRVMLTPNYYYLKNGDKQNEVERINEWLENAQTQPFTEIFLVTVDSKWKKVEKELNGSLIWLPGTHSVDIHSKEMRGIIRDQVEQVGELIRSYW